MSDTLVSSFPITYEMLTNHQLIELGKRLQSSLDTNSELKIIRTRDGSEIAYAEFFVFKSKPIINQIDTFLAKHYGFTYKELDFITNYDIKYRMGQDDGNGVE